MENYKLIFIGGVPGVGKTSISGVIAKELGIDLVLSGDYLREFVRDLDIKNAETLKHSVYDSWKLFGEKNSGNIIKGFKAQSEIMCDGISATLKRAFNNGESLIIESLYINEELLKTINETATKAAYIYISDWQTHADRLNERELYTHFKSPGARLSAQLDVYRTIMDYSKSISEAGGIKLFDNVDYLATRKEMVNFFRDAYAGK
ncbi:MAG: AAA family ATPase [Candidatus Marsarchaeota archaeon]|nr:AAA family ATPase [Candidatus Marsarchaeota archaeon]